MNNYLKFKEYVFKNQSKNNRSYFELNADELPICEYILDLMNGSDQLLMEYSDDEIADGFDYLINPSLSNYSFLFFGKNTSNDMAIRFFESSVNVYKNVFDFRCKSLLSRNSDVLIGKMNGVCYMWWEIIPFSQKFHSEYGMTIENKLIDSLKEILACKNIACKEGALLGFLNLTMLGMQSNNSSGEKINKVLSAIESEMPTILKPLVYEIQDFL